MDIALRKMTAIYEEQRPALELGELRSVMILVQFDRKTGKPVGTLRAEWESL